MTLFYIKGSLVSICNLRTIKAKCPDFRKIYRTGFGAYSHHNDGSNYKSNKN